MKVEPLVAHIIAFEGRLSADEKQMLGDLRNTEPFRILRKLCAEQHALITMKISACETERQMTLAQGQLLGVQGIYNMLMTLGTVEKKSSPPLPLHEKILQDVNKRGS